MNKILVTFKCGHENELPLDVEVLWSLLHHDTKASCPDCGEPAVSVKMSHVEDKPGLVETGTSE